MADANYVNFTKRLTHIDRKHRKLSRGYVQLVERDGLLVPKAQRSVRRGFPFRGLLLTLAVFLLFKGFLLAQLGAITFESRVAKLSSGSAVEQVGGWAMRADPITIWISGQLAPLF